MTARAVPQIGEQGYERIAFDEYRTPPWVTDILIDNYGPISEVAQVWEPAAGQLDMVRQIRARGLNVFASDIRPLPDLDRAPCDFPGGLDWAGALDRRDIPFPDAIITNPPFAFAEDFIRRALSVTEKREGIVAMLLGHDYDTALTARGWMFHHPAFTAKIMLGRRITWLGLEGKASPRQIHAWYVWDWAQIKTGRPVIIYPRAA